MILNDIVASVLILIWIVGIIISGVHTVLIKSKKGTHSDVPWKKMKLGIVMVFLPVINYFPIRSFITGDWRKKIKAQKK